VQGEVDGLPGAEQAGADREIDVEAGELRAEGASLRAPSRGQRDRLGRGGAENVGGVRRGFSVPGKYEQAEHVSRHRRPPSLVLRASGSPPDPLDGARRRALG
jgi:hypothetical protein